jgi:ribosomal protein S18 acetylase RimI-like enzyme
MTDQDLDAVASIQERITRAPVSDQWRENLAQHVGDKLQSGIVADEHGQVLGFIFGEVKVGGFGAETSGWFEKVGVAPEYMGSGIGRNLAQGLITHFQAQGVQDVLTSVMWDSSDMLAFFKDLDFDRSPFINLQIRLETD